MADKLTPQQSMAVHDRGGMLLVSAAAGSGKTKVLVDRLLTYLTDPKDPANLDEFLIITYTKAAASELRGKIAAKLTERIAAEPENRHIQKQMQRLFLTKISTVHGFCGDLLREYAYKLDIGADFRVADEAECLEIRERVLTDILDRAYETAQEDSDFRAFVDTQGLGRDDRLIPQIVQKVYDSARCHLNPEEWLEYCMKSAYGTDCEDASETVWGKFLIEDLFAYLDIQIRIMSGCLASAEQIPEFEKVSMNLRDTLYQLQMLRNARSWDEIVRYRTIDYGRLTFPRKNPDPDLTERIKAARNACKKGLEKKLHSFADDSAQVMLDLAQCASGVSGLFSLVTMFDKAYSHAKKSRRCLDFSDLEHKTLDLLLGRSRSSPTSAATEIGRRFREILVDEYQDSNEVQDAIFMALSRERQNCFMVGDVKQSIYQFRLADPGIFLEKYHSYRPAEEAERGQGRKVLLSHNFRSGAEVIECVNDVFRTCMRPEVGGLYYGEDEQLREGIPHIALPDAGVELYAIDVQEETYPEEAAFVAERIYTMLKQGTGIRKGGTLQPVTPEDIVILLRSPGTAAGYFQRALESRGIPCTSGNGTDLLKTQEIATFRCFLQTIMNPRQDIPLLSTLVSPLFGFSADDLAAFRANQKRGTVYDALCSYSSAKVKAFLRILDTLRWEARMNTLTGLLEKCFALTRMDSVYGAMAGGESRIVNLQTFYQLASDFEKGNHRDLSQFLDHLDSMEERGLVTAASSVSSGAVSIMSIHKSKGLEFPVVFLCNLSRKFNQEDIRAQILCDKSLGLGLSAVDPENRTRYPSLSKRAISVKMAAQSVSEELRVLYVAMTRARDRLIMTYASQTLENDLKDIALRMDLDGGELLSREAICLGDWVLLAAMGRTEAGELHSLGGRTANTRIGKYPWKIIVTECSKNEIDAATAEKAEKKLPENVLSDLQTALSFQYAHEAATMAPSKQTATGRKGRIKDAEAAENTREPRPAQRTWRRPSFVTQMVDGKTVGNAIHSAMQYLYYENCGSVEQVREELIRLTEIGYLNPEQARLVDAEKIATFFATEIGKKLRSGVPYLREFKFSILDQGEHYGEDLDGEKVLLQGVVDCALLEPDGIIIVDFKTDYVTDMTVHQRSEYYRPQLEAYSEALSRIYEMPVKKKLLYFFALNQYVEV